jgi:hypothetical protein
MLKILSYVNLKFKLINWNLLPFWIMQSRTKLGLISSKQIQIRLRIFNFSISLIQIFINIYSSIYVHI